MPKHVNRGLAGISFNDLVNALTNPDKRFEFPIKPIETKIILTRETQITILATATILAAGIIIAFKKPTE